MRKDSRLSRVLHTLIHLDQAEGGLSSTQIAAMQSTNPVVVRRTMGALRERGYVQSASGRGGGWTLAKPLADISLLDIHQSFGESSLFTIGLVDEHQNCAIEAGINRALKDAMSEAEALLLQRFASVYLDSLV